MADASTNLTAGQRQLNQAQSTATELGVTATDLLGQAVSEGNQIASTLQTATDIARTTAANLFDLNSAWQDAENFWEQLKNMSDPADICEAAEGLTGTMGLLGSGLGAAAGAMKAVGLGLGARGIPLGAGFIVGGTLVDLASKTAKHVDAAMKDELSKNMPSSEECEDQKEPEPDPNDNQPVSPLIVDLNGNGAHSTTHATSNTFFDLNQDGLAEWTAWVSPQDGLLAFDRDNSGTIDNISELFGNATQDGFTILRQLDSNGDDVIDAQDVQFAELQIWKDTDQDGTTDVGELSTLADLDIVAISLTTTAGNRLDSGNIVSHDSTVTLGSGATLQISDIWFEHSDKVTRKTVAADFEYNIDAVRLPQLMGYSGVGDLHYQMTQDADLRTLVHTVTVNAHNMTGGEFRSMIEQILWKWAGVDPALSPFARGGNIDARHLETVEKFFGRDYIQTAGENAGTANPGRNSGYMVEQSYQKLIDSFMTRFATQVWSKALDLAGDDLDAIVAQLNSPFARLHLIGFDEETGLSGKGDVTIALKYIAAGVPQDGNAAMRYLDVSMGSLKGLFSDAFDGNLDEFKAAVSLSLTSVGDLALRYFAEQRAVGDAYVTGTDGGETITGKDYAEVRLQDIGVPKGSVVWSGAGDDTLRGRLGGDTYVFTSGDGVDIVDDQGAPDFAEQRTANGSFPTVINIGGTDAVVFVGRTFQQATFSVSGVDVIVNFGNGDAVRIVGQLRSGGTNQIERFIFSDIAMTASELRSAVLFQHTDGDDTITGSPLNDVLTGGLGNDVLSGQGGDDIYLYAPGNGNDTVIETADSGEDMLRLDGITTADVTVTADGSDALIAVNMASAGTIRLKDQFASATGAGVERVQLSDGTTWTTVDLAIQRAGGLNGPATVTGTAAAESVIGTSGDDIIDAGAGNDSVQTGTGADAVLFGLGYGQDTLTVERANAALDVKVVRLAVAQRDVFLSKIGNTLVISLTQEITLPNGDTSSAVTGDELSIINHFNGGQIDRLEFADGSYWDLQRINAYSAGEPGILRLRNVDASELLTDLTYSRGSHVDAFGYAQYGTDLIISRNGVQIARIDDQFLEFTSGTTLIQHGVNEIILDDGTKVGRQQIVDLTPLIGTDGYDGSLTDSTTHYGELVKGFAGDEYLYTRDGNDTLVGGLGSDILVGDAGTFGFSTTTPPIVAEQGSDTYIWSKGDGNDRLLDTGIGIVDVDRLVLTDVSRDDLLLERVRPTWSNSSRFADLAIHIRSTGETIFVERQFSNKIYGIEEIVLGDGTIIDRTEIAKSAYILGTSASDTLSGSGIFDAAAGDDLLFGGSDPTVDDIVVFRAGSGDDYVDSMEVIRAEGLSAEDVTFTRDNDALIITIVATGEFLTVARIFEPDWWQTEMGSLPFAPDLQRMELADGKIMTIDEILSIATIRGSSGDDFVSGSESGDILSGGDGADELSGFGGDDTILGDGGDDIAFGDDGDDTFLASPGDGDDEYIGGAGLNTYDASKITTSVTVDLESETAAGSDVGADILIEINRVVGGSGDDSLTGGLGDDVLDGYIGADAIQGGGGDDILIGGAGADQLAGGVGLDTASYVSSRSGVDVDILRGTGLGGHAQGDVLDGIENVTGSNFNDSIGGDAASNILRLGQGDDTADGRAGGDFIYGGVGADAFGGGDGDDLLDGGSGADIVSGGSGDDEIIGGTGADQLAGDEGSDTYVWQRGDGQDVITDTGTQSTDTDTLSLIDLTLSDVTLFRLRETLLIETSSSERIEIVGQFSDIAGRGLETITFSDGSSIDRTFIASNATVLGNVATVAVEDGVYAAETNIPLSIAFTELLSNDFDSEGDQLTIVSVANALHGSVALSQDGAVVFTPQTSYVGSASFEYTVTDGFGGTSTAIVAVDVQQSVSGNRAPELVTAIPILELDEDVALNFIVPAETFADPDGDPLTYSAALSDGAQLPSWMTFDTATRTFGGIPPLNFNGSLDVRVTASDGALAASALFTLTINPVNDAAVLSSAIVALGETDAPLSTVGTLTITDIDSAAAFVAQTNVAGANGTFSIDATGAWTYTANSAFDSLNVGDSVSDTFTVTAVDGTQTTVQVTINGTNDAAVVSSAIVDLDEANEALSAGGSLTISDVDSPAFFVAQTNVSGANGTFSIDAFGNWSYAATSAFDGLNVGDSLSDTFTVAAADGTTTTVKVTINGANDTAVLSSAVVNLDETDTALSTGGTLTVSDIDNPATFVAQSNVAGANGTFSITSAGAWNYTANSAFDSLNVGESVSDTFTVSAVDGTTTTVKVTINGSNDAAVLSAAVVALSETDAALSAGGTLTIMDVDSPAAFVAQSNGAGSNGTFSIDATGNWTYTANSAFDNLNVGDSVVDTFTVAAADGTTTTVKVTINGTNDAPVVSGSVTANATEDGAVVTVSALENAVDVDSAAASLVVTSLPAALPSGVTYNATNKTFSLNPADPAYQHLASGATQVVTVNYAVSDGTTSTPASVSFTVTGINDAAVIAGTAAGTVTEDTTLTATGALTVVDIDDGQASFQAGSYAATYGSLSLAASGAWTYTLDNTLAAVQGLNSGQTLADNVTVRSADGTTKVIAITINGQNESTSSILGTDGSDILIGTTASNVIDAKGGADIVLAGLGDDRITGGAGSDILYGDTGNDTFIATLSDGSDIYVGGAGSDTYDLSAISTAVSINLSTGYATGSQIGTDALVGLENVIGGSANDTLAGNSLSNLLAGGAGSDTLSGGAGNDRLIGGAGNDLLNGGTGNDTFVFLPGFGKDVVSGFVAGAASGDVLEIGLGTAYDTLAEILANAAQSGANTVITFDASTSITLQNVSKVALTADDFHFI